MPSSSFRPKCQLPRLIGTALLIRVPSAYRRPCPQWLSLYDPSLQAFGLGIASSRGDGLLRSCPRTHHTDAMPQRGGDDRHLHCKGLWLSQADRYLGRDPSRRQRQHRRIAAHCRNAGCPCRVRAATGVWCGADQRVSKRRRARSPSWGTPTTATISRRSTPLSLG